MTTYNVPGDYSTIQLAIDNSSPGGTIIVAPGFYMEQLIIPASLSEKTLPSSGLTLLGAQANMNSQLRGSILPNPLTDSIITYPVVSTGTGVINVLSRNVTINGFTISTLGAPVEGTSAISAGDTVDVTGLQIRNNIIQNNANDILVASAKSNKTLIKDNYFYNNNIKLNSPIIYTPSAPLPRPRPPILLTKTAANTNVSPGEPISFTITLTIDENSPPAGTFTDVLPSLPSGNLYVISAESPSGTFTLTGTNPQTLVFTELGEFLPPGTYSVTVTAYTSLLDSGAILVNTANISSTNPNLNQSISADALVVVDSLPLPICDMVLFCPLQECHEHDCYC
jgi:hypothetical protein